MHSTHLLDLIAQEFGLDEQEIIERSLLALEEGTTEERLQAVLLRLEEDIPVPVDLGASLIAEGVILSDLEDEEAYIGFSFA